MWEKLVTVLTEMLETYKTVLELSHRKRDLLVTVKTKEIEALTRDEELLIIKLGKLEKERQAILAELAAVYNLDNDKLTLKAIKAMAEQPVVESLSTIDAEFTKITGELADLNRLNTMLIQQSLEYVNYNLNVLTQNCADPTYQTKGQAGNSSQSRILVDTKV